jgi:uncharacterized protein with HEPN domain
MSERTYLDYLGDILDALEKIKGFIEGMSFKQFTADTKTSFAVVRAFEIVGEATKRLPAELKDRSRYLPWKEMAGMRDRLIHDYIGVDLLVVWRAATEEAPALELQIRALLETPDVS